MVSELPHYGGNHERFPVSSTLISPCCQLKFITWLAQTNHISFLPTKEGFFPLQWKELISTPNQKSEMVPAVKGLKLFQAARVLLLLKHGYCPGNYQVILHCPLLTLLTQISPLELPLLSQAHS